MKLSPIVTQPLTSNTSHLAEQQRSAQPQTMLESEFKSEFIQLEHQAEPVSCSHSDPAKPSEISSQATQLTARREFEIFVSTFITIFLAELGDKTQLTTLLMSAESQSPWIVFLGSGAALIATSLLGVLVGRWLAAQVSQKTLETTAAVILLTVAVLLLWDVVQI